MPTTTSNNDTVSTMPSITNNNYVTTIVGYALPSHKPTLSTSWPQSTCHSLAVRCHCSRRTEKFTTGLKPGISTFLTPLHDAYNFLQYFLWLAIPAICIHSYFPYQAYDMLWLPRHYLILQEECSFSSNTVSISWRMTWSKIMLYSNMESTII